MKGGLKIPDVRIKQLYWFVTEDQIGWVNRKSENGLTKAEIYRRIIDFCIDNQEDLSAFVYLDHGAKRKDYINITASQYTWISSFPRGKWASSLRKCIEYYRLKKEEL